MDSFTPAEGVRRGILGTALSRPTSVLVLLVSILVIGVIAYRSIPLQLVPPGFELGQMSISIPVEESTPREVMEQVAEPAEELIRSIPGIRTIKSWASANRCRVTVYYGSDADADAIYSDLRDRMERLLPTLPDGADRYRIFRLNLEVDIPIVQAAVSYDESIQDPDTLLENVIAKRIEGIDGVARTEVRGLIDTRLEIELEPALVEAYEIDVQRLIERLRNDNVISPGGAIEFAGKKYLLRMNSQFSSIEEIRNFPVTDSLRLDAIADVREARGVRNVLVRVNGKPCKTLVVSKEAGANTLATCKRVLAAIEEELPQDPRLQGFSIFAFMNQGDMIEDSVDVLKQSCAWGGLIAILVLYLFLRKLALTFIIAMAIPLSLTIAVVVIFFRGGTFNVISITGLTLGIGMLIDNAIVIAENIFRLRSGGRSAKEAASMGAREVALAVTLGTLTTVAVFVPGLFIGSDSNTRLLLSEIGLPVCYSVLASLFVALIFMPLATTYLPSLHRESKPEDTDEVVPSRSQGRLIGTYSRLLGLVLRQRLLASLILLVVLGVSIQAAFSQLTGKEAEKERARAIQVRVECASHFTLADTDEALLSIRNALVPHQERLNIEDQVAWFSSSGGALLFLLTADGAVAHRDFFAQILPLLPDLPGVELSVGGSDDEERQIRIEARGEDPEILRDLLESVALEVREFPDVLAVRTEAESSPDEVEVGIQRERAQRFQVNPNTAAMLVGWALRGAPLNDYETADGEMQMWISYKGSDVDGISSLSSVNVFSDTGESLPLSNLAELTTRRGLPTIYRSNGRVESGFQLIALSKDDAKKALGVEDDDSFPSLKERVAEVFANHEVPEGYELVFNRGSGDQEAQRDSALAGLLGLVLIVVLMGILFESFLLPLAVLATVPFMFIGALWSLVVANSPLTQIASVGFVILLGVVVNNAIVLVDTIHRFASTHASRTEAVIHAARARVRPILMTAATTICGLVPLVLQQGGGEGFDYRPLALVVMGGLISSTVFTLLVAPIAYTVLDDLRDQLWTLVAGPKKHGNRSVENSVFTTEPANDP